MTICPIGAELFNAEGRTDGPSDMTKLIVEFGNVAKASKKTEFPNMSLTYVDRKLTPGEALLSVVRNYQKAIKGRWCAKEVASSSVILPTQRLNNRTSSAERRKCRCEYRIMEWRYLNDGRRASFTGTFNLAR